MNIPGDPLHIDLFIPGVGETPELEPGASRRAFTIAPPQRASQPYDFGRVTLSTGAPADPAAALSVGPFSARRAWSGDPDEDRYTILMIALTNAQPGREEEFDDWYWNRHFLDGQQLPGCYAGCRFALAEGGDGPFRHLALYQFDVADPAVIVDAHIARAGTPAMPLTTAISPVFQAWYLRPAGDWRHAR
jgi:hypothetical protein